MNRTVAVLTATLAFAAVLLPGYWLLGAFSDFQAVPSWKRFLVILAASTASFLVHERALHPRRGAAP